MGKEHLPCRPINPVKKIAFGVLILAAGVLLLGFNLGYLDPYFKPIVFSWKSLLIALGVINIFSKDNWIMGTALILVGGVFIAPDLYPFNYSFIDVLIPLLLIQVGVMVILKKPKTFGDKLRSKFSNHKNGDNSASDEPNGNSLDEINIFSGGRMVMTNSTFEGGSVINIFGGLELDLRQTELAREEVTIETVNIFGGFSIIVPPHWEIKTETTSILGGFADKRTEIQPTPSNKRLIVKGVNIFGGGEIKTTVWVKH